LSDNLVLLLFYVRYALLSDNKFIMHFPTIDSIIYAVNRLYCPKLCLWCVW